MAPNDISPLFAVLQQRAKDFKFAFDADIAKCIEAFDSMISTLMLHPNSIDVSSDQKYNTHVEFSRAKCLILANMKQICEDTEKKWIDYLNKIEAEFLDNMKFFLNNTKLVVNLPVLEVSSRFDANSDSPNSVYDHGAGCSQYSVKQKSLEAKVKKSCTENPISMLSRLPDTSRHCHIDTENIRPQDSGSQLLNNTGQQMTFSQSFVGAATNQGVSYPTTNASNTTYQSLTPSINNQCEIALPSNASNESTQIHIPGFSYQPATCSNATNQNLIPEDPLYTNSAPQIEPGVELPKLKYGCPSCPKSFRHKSLLERHMPHHTKEKRYVCKHCGKKLSHQGAQYNHEQLSCKKRRQNEQ